MKILQIGKFYPIKGGVEKVMYDLTIGLSSQGIECDMMCAAVEGDTRDVKLNGKATMFLCKTVTKKSGTMISPAMISRLREVCDNYDVIHVHHPDPMAALALYCSGYKGKVVLHWHSDIIKQKTILKFYSPLQAWLIERADVIVGTTPVYTAQSKWLTKVQHKITSLPIGVPIVEPDAAEVAKVNEKYEGKKIIFALGRLVPYKGFSYLIDAASFLGDDWVILIGGSGPMYANLRDEIKRHNLSDKVKLLGYVPDEEVSAYYGACTLFCLSSVFKTEAFGIVQIEAMSCGKPVVATKLPQSGVSWVNEHGVSGLNVEPFNSEALADAFMEISGNEEKYAAYCKGARERYEKWFTREMMIEKCKEIYETLWK